MRSSADSDYGFDQPLSQAQGSMDQQQKQQQQHQQPYQPQQYQQQQYQQQQQSSGSVHGGGGGGGSWQQGTYGECGGGCGADASSSGQMSGAMSGQMGGGGLLGSLDGASPRANLGMRARNISSTLLGEGEPDEPPILEELGINFSHIFTKTKAVLWPRRAKLDQQVIDDCDFAGPLLFCLALATLLLLKGKVQFSYIYIVFITGLFSLWAVLNLMSLRGLDIYRTASVLGYCLLPIVLLAALSIPLDLTGVWGTVFVPLAIFWCSNAAAIFFVVILQADDQRWLLLYPVMLFYTCFALITIF